MNFPIIDRSEEFEWIVANRDAYRGRWVAVQGNRLVADAPSFPEIQSRIQKLKSPPLVHRIDYLPGNGPVLGSERPR